MISKILKQLSQHKLVAVIALVAIIGVGRFGYKSLAEDKNPVQYITAQARRGTLILSVSGSGQVSASNQIDITPKVSGKIVAVHVVSGQEVKAGTLLVQIDSSDAWRAAQDAETSLETARLELERILDPPDELSLLQSENSLLQVEESRQKAEDGLKKAFEDGFNEVADAFLDLPGVMTGLKDILYKSTVNGSQSNIDAYADMAKKYDDGVWRYKAEADDDYQTARDRYDASFESYKSSSRYSDNATIEALIDDAYQAAKDIAEAVKSAKNLIDFTEDTLTLREIGLPSIVSSHQSTLSGHIGTTNSLLSSLLSAQRKLVDSRESILSANRTIEERRLSLAKLIDGADDFDIRAKKIAIQQKENALRDANIRLGDHFVRATFDGVVAGVNAKKGVSASSNTTLVTLITEQKIAEVTLNEIDIAKVEVGQPATLRFDAIEDLTLTGKVAEIDELGTTSQGVVSYNVIIAFDTQDTRIKPGMTIDAAIVHERKNGAVLVPNSAVQTRSGQVFVDVMQEGTPQPMLVEVGLSNELSTEVLSGVQEGDEVVTARLGGESASASSASQSFRMPGFGGGGSSGSFRGGGGFIQH